jgi:hypothetical protein
MNMKKILSLTLSLIMTLMLLPAGMATPEDSPAAMCESCFQSACICCGICEGACSACNECKSHPCACPHNYDGCCIYYDSESEVIVPGYVAIPPGEPDDHDDSDDPENSGWWAVTGCPLTDSDLFSPAPGFFIDLTRETITVPDDYEVEAISMDARGMRWIPVKDKLSPERFHRILNRKGVTLRLSDRLPDIKPNSKLKRMQPPQNATVIEFPQIAARPKIPRMRVNYSIHADMSGAGKWVLTDRNGGFSNAIASPDDTHKLQIAAADSTQRKPDEKGYGYLYPIETPRDMDGICVKPQAANNQSASVYFLRIGAGEPTEATPWQYTPASKTRRIRASTELRRPNYRIQNNIIVVNANTYVTMNGNTVLYADRARIDVSDISGRIWLWQGATEKRPSSARQVLGG